MKFSLLLLSLAIVSRAFSATEVTLPTTAPVSDDALLAAIADVETGNNAAKRGRYGERTQLQILPTTWRQFSRLPHSASANNPEETDRVARAYLSVIRARLRARGLPETPFFIAAGWNAGPGWKKLTNGTVTYAERVANIVEASQPKETFARAVETTGPTVSIVSILPKSTKLFAQVNSVPMIQVAE